MAESLKQSLDLYHMDALRQIAEHLKVDLPKGTVRKVWIVDAVDKRIREIAGSPDFIGNLGQAERALLALLLKNGGVGTQRTITLPLLKAGLIYVEGQDTTIDLPRMRDVVLRLMRTGLVLNLDDVGTMSTRRLFEPFNKIGIAPEVACVLPRELLTVPEPLSIAQSVPLPPRIESTDAELFLRQLFFLWAELRREPVNLLKAGGIGKRDLRRIAKGLLMDEERDAERLQWMQSILQALKLITTTPTTMEALDSDAVKLFWDASPRTQLAAILQSYANVTSSIPLSLSTITQYVYYSTVPIRSSKEIRGQVLNLLKEIADAQWFPFSLFVAFLSEGRSGSLVIADNGLNSLYTNLRWYAGGRRDDLTTALQQLDRQAALTVLKELQRLGVVELGYPATGGVPSALQLTPLARAHFANQPLPAATNGGQVILQPDFQILAMGPVALRILANLERFATRENFAESVVAYRVTREGTYRALQRGESPQTICAFLEEATGQPVPQNVIRTLEEWGEQYERIVIRRDITILQVDDTGMLDRLLNDKATGKLLHRLDAHTAWLRAKDTAKLEAHLQQQEMLPAYSQGPEADLPRSLRWDQDTLRPRHPMPSLYVTGTLRRIAVQHGDHWELTRQSLRTAVATGMDVPAVIALLEQMTGAPLSPEWQKQLKAWGSHYGDAQIASAILLHLESDDALRELLRTDRRLGRWIKPLPHAPGLGVIDAKHYDEVLALLGEWGIAVEDKPWW
ncbi:MAG: helicase-associated domain-containing protein [Anaerolineae bacterium]